MTMCSRCHKRVAVIFLTRMDNGESKSEGLCLKCAKELGIKPIDDVIAQTGLDDEAIERLNGEMDAFMDAMSGGDAVPAAEGDDSQTRTPFINFEKLMNQGAQGQGDGKKEPRRRRSEKEEEKEPKFLKQYTTNLTEKAAKGEIDRVVGRERELERVIQILCRRQKNNPCLIGEPGVGKTAIAEALALRVAAGEVPYRLKNSAIHLVDLTALVAGTQFRGQFESRVLGLLNDVKTRGNVILVIDEVHNLVGVGDAEGSMNAANILKPALSRGEIQVIGATTMTEYRKYIEKDSALERRYQPVTVNEPSIADTVEILKGIREYYESYHNIKIPEAVLESAAVLSERYITDRYLPDKAIDLIDEAASHISVHSAALTERHMLRDRRGFVEKKRNELEAAEVKDNDSAALEEHYKALADLKAEEYRIEERLAELEPLCEAIRMTEADLADVIEIWTGVPASTITESEYTRLAQLEDRLKMRIIGQDEAVNAVSRAIRRNRAGVSYKRKPVSFIFAGPTGVGKTELVKVLAQDLFSAPDALIRVDMSEFMEKYSVSRIIGSAPGYVGYDDAGQLTEKIRRRPYSVVLFDEIEKAHPDVMNILLQILDDGIITDSHGKQVDFSNTVIVMTTNAGSGTGGKAAGFAMSAQAAVEDKTRKALNDFLRPEFINRVDEIITFRHLTKEDFTHIARIMLGDLAGQLEKKGISIVFREGAYAYVAEKSYSETYGARNMRRLIQKEIEDPIAGEIINKKGAISAISVDAGPEGITLVSL